MERAPPHLILLPERLCPCTPSGSTHSRGRELVLISVIRAWNWSGFLCPSVYAIRDFGTVGYFLDLLLFIYEATDK